MTNPFIGPNAEVGGTLGENWDKRKCASCGSTNLRWDPADGLCCLDCNATDADE